MWFGGGIMLIVLKKISPEVVVDDVEQFVEPVLAGGFLKKTGWIEEIRIQMTRPLDKKWVEYYALVDIEPLAVAKRAAKVLDRKRLKNKYINVSLFRVRSSKNDRRAKHSDSSLDRRRSERRRLDVQVIDVTKQRLNERGLAELRKKEGWRSDLIR
jgi:hypothetical protein